MTKEISLNDVVRHLEGGRNYATRDRPKGFAPYRFSGGAALWPEERNRKAGINEITEKKRASMPVCKRCSY